MSVLGLIPARYASTRFPGKPLAEILGVPMIERVYRGAAEATCLDDLRVATDDARIADACRSFGAAVCLTRADHATGSDRIPRNPSMQAIATQHLENILNQEPESLLRMQLSYLEMLVCFLRFPDQGNGCLIKS